MMAARPVTLLSGGSSGIGAALAKVFAERRHELVLVALSATELAQVADEIVAHGGQRPTCLVVDLREDSAGLRIAETLADLGLEPEFVVNCAGFGLVGLATKLGSAEQLAMIDVNVRALTELSLVFAASVARHRGGILNVASVAGFLPGPGMAVYHATKAYVLAFSEALRHELAPKGVRVTALCPGPVETAFLERAGVNNGKIPKFFFISAETVALQGYEGLMRGRREVVPGIGWKLLVILSRFLPRSLQTSLLFRNHRRLNRPRFADYG
jgi:uncharacterized protein